MTSSIPSFDHLPSAMRSSDRDRYDIDPIQAQIRRNGQLKYQRTQVVSRSEEMVMPDGEVVARRDDGHRR
jgi:hypothetical protein